MEKASLPQAPSLPRQLLPDLRDLPPDLLVDRLGAIGLSPSQALRIFAAIHRPGITNFLQLAGISGRILALLADKTSLSFLTPSTVESSRDGTRKFLFTLTDGAAIESVLIPEGERHTLCVSSQAGCAMGCTFCLTGAGGLTRNLSAAEIVNQVLAVMHSMEESGIRRATPRELINNLVFMGMGEPLANYHNLLAALRILMDERGLGFSARRVTVSTCGIAPRILDLGRDVRVNLAISLHAASDPVRSRLMPVNRTWNLDSLLAACRGYPLGKKGLILFEYVLLAGINDAPADAHRLAGLLADIPGRINLLPYNPSSALPYRCPDAERVLAFQKILRDAGFKAFIRKSRGADIAAACGQLAGQHPPVPKFQESGHGW